MLPNSQAGRSVFSQIIHPGNKYILLWRFEVLEDVWILRYREWNISLILVVAFQAGHIPSERRLHVRIMPSMVGRDSTNLA